MLKSFVKSNNNNPHLYAITSITDYRNIQKIIYNDSGLMEKIKFIFNVKNIVYPPFKFRNLVPLTKHNFHARIVENSKMLLKLPTTGLITRWKLHGSDFQEFWRASLQP